MFVLIVNDTKETSTVLDISAKGLDTTVASLCANAGVDVETHGLAPGVPNAVPSWATDAKVVQAGAEDVHNKALTRMLSLSTDVRHAERNVLLRQKRLNGCVGESALTQRRLDEAKEHLRVFVVKLSANNHDSTTAFMARVLKSQELGETARKRELERAKRDRDEDIEESHETQRRLRETVTFFEGCVAKDAEDEAVATRKLEQAKVALQALKAQHDEAEEEVNAHQSVSDMYRLMKVSSRDGGAPSTRRRRLDEDGSSFSGDEAGDVTLADNGVAFHEGCDIITLWARPKRGPSGAKRSRQVFKETLTPHPASEYWGVVPPADTHRVVNVTFPLAGAGADTIVKFREYVKTDGLVKTMQSPGWTRLVWGVQERVPTYPPIQTEDVNEAGGRLLTPADVAALPGGGKTKDAIIEVMKLAPFGGENWGKNNRVVEIAGSAATWLAIGVESGRFPVWAPRDIDLFIEGNPEYQKRDTAAISSVARCFPCAKGDTDGEKMGTDFINKHTYAVVGLESNDDMTVQVIDARCQRFALTTSFDLSPCRVRLTYQGRGTPEEGWKLFIDTDAGDLLSDRMTVYASFYYRDSWTERRIAKYMERGWKNVTLAPGIIYPSWRVTTYHQADAPPGDNHLTFDPVRARIPWERAVADAMDGRGE